MRLALLAAAILVATGLGSAYAAGALGGDAHPRPAATGVAPPPPDKAELAAIRQLVLQAASNFGDPTPTNGVVVPTARRLAELVDVDTAEADTPVYFVLVHGAFTDYAARIPKGGKAPTGTLLTLTIDAATNDVLGSGLVGAMRDVSAIGDPEPLQLPDRRSTLRADLRLTKNVPCLTGREPRVGPDVLRTFRAVTAVSCVDAFRTYPGEGLWEVLVRRIAVGSVAGMQRYFERPDGPDLPKNAVCSTVLIVTLVPIFVDARGQSLVPRTPVDGCYHPLDGGPPEVRWHVVRVHRVKQILSAAAVAASCPMRWGNSVAWAGPPRNSAGGPLFHVAPKTVRVCVFRTPPDRFAVGRFVRGFRLDASRTRRLLGALTGAGPKRGCAKQRTFAVVIASPGSAANVELGGCWRVDRADRLAGTAKPAVVRAILGVR